MRALKYFVLLAPLITLSGCISASPLGRAVKLGQLDTVNALLAQGADPCAQQIGGLSALNYAMEDKRPDIARALLQKCLEICGPDRDCPYAIGHAAMWGDLNMVKAFLAKGADLDEAIVQVEKLEARLSKILFGNDTFAPHIARAKQGLALLKVLDAERKAGGQTTASTGVSKEEVSRLLDAAVMKSAQIRPEPSKIPSIASDIDKPAYSKPANPDDYALVVGIEKYAGLPEARFAERDAESVREHLVALGYPERNVVLLTGQQASRAGLAKNIETWLPRNVGERSTVFFYYSGHGAPDPETGQAYLVPADGDPQYLNDTAYPIKRLYEKLGALKAKRVIVALDSCFSGAGGRSVLAKGIKPLVSKVDMGPAASDKIVMFSASAADQISGTEEPQGHGLFTYYFLRGLNGAAKDEQGRVTVKALYDYLLPNVQDKAHRGNREQTPQLTPGSPDGAELRLR